MPDLLAEGAIEGEAYLHGTLSSPAGDIRLNASAVRFASDAAAGLPALDLRANASLLGDSAAVDARLSSGGASLFTISGAVPLHQGPVDLKIMGNLDIALFNPLLEARGMRAAGHLDVDAAVGGSRADPQIRAPSPSRRAACGIMRAA